MNFFDELKPRYATVQLDGQEIRVERARLGLFLELQHIALKTEPERILEYVSLATGVPPTRISAMNFADVLAAYEVLLELNTLHGPFPFMGRGGRDSLDYPGRDLALMVHRLAGHYGWTRDEILSLQPEEAMFYVLETLVSDHDEREYLYRLSLVGVDQSGRKKPFPALRMAWPGESEKPPPILMTAEDADRLGFVPAGVVIDLEELVRERNDRRKNRG